MSQEIFSFMLNVMNLVVYIFISASRNSTRRILPEFVFGRCSTNSIALGYLYGATSFYKILVILGLTHHLLHNHLAR